MPTPANAVYRHGAISLRICSTIVGVHFLVVENAVLDRVETADSLQGIECAAGRDETVDALQFGQNLFVLEAGQQHGDRLAEHRRRLFLAFRIDQDHLRDEVELTQRRGGVFRLQNVVFKKERHIIQEFQRDLAVDAQNRAVDEDSSLRL